MNYRRAWRVAFWLVALTGVAVAVLSYPLAVTAGMVTVGLVMGGALGYALSKGGPDVQVVRSGSPAPRLSDWSASLD
jgi:hypothetical protein